MRLASVAEIQELESLSFREFQLSPERLMENAGQKMAIAFVKKYKPQATDKVLVICGRGHNGGDGFVFARELQQSHLCQVKVLFFAGPHTSELWKKVKEKCEITGVEMAQVDSQEGVQQLINWADYIADAIYGVGLNRAIEGEEFQLIDLINRAKKIVIAIDMPSGLDAEKGIPLGIAVRSDLTMTCGVAKPGLFLQEGPSYAKRVQVIDIGFPQVLVQKICQRFFYIGLNAATRMLPRRSATANKSNFGHLLVIAGSAGMGGAAILTATAAARMGCGYVTVCSNDHEIKKLLPPDFLFLKLQDFYKSDLKKYSAVAVGPGLGQKSETKKIIKYLYKKHDRVIVDADALTVCARENLWPLPGNWLLTPHAGEMARILNCSAKEIEQSRLESVQRASALCRCHILLKGFRTIVQANNRSYLIGAGNVALAKAGSGDVLTGFIASLVAQGLAVDRAAVLGAWLHGHIADEWKRKGYSDRTMMASDLVGEISRMLRLCQS